MGGHSWEQPGEQSAGIRPMNIAGRTIRERERLSGMTAEDRAWRKKWLSDQIISDKEPRYVKEMQKEFLNPIRRFYRAPMDFVFHRLLQPFIGEYPATVARFYICRGSLIALGIYSFYYLVKFNHNTWINKSGWRVIQNKAAIYPGEPGYGVPIPDRPKDDYYDRGFKESVLYNRNEAVKKAAEKCN